MCRATENERRPKLTVDNHGQENCDGGKYGTGVAALDSRARQRAMQDIGPLARELRATMTTAAVGLKPSTDLATALGGDHRSMFKAFQDGLTSATGLGSAFQEMMRAQSSAGGSIKRIAESLKLPAGHTSWTSAALGGSLESITAHMQSWSRLAEAGHWIARLALRMALAAKDAVIRGDRETVKQFMLDWLGFKKISWDLVNSASLVLLVNGRPMLSLSIPVSADDPCYTLLDRQCPVGWWTSDRRESRVVINESWAMLGDLALLG